MRRSLCAFVVVSCVAAAFAGPFTQGNLVVTRVGDGSAALSNAAAATFLDEYTPAGVLVQSIPLPTAISGLNHRLTNSGTATSEGFLTRSVDGQYLLLAGYDAAVGTLSVAGTTSAAVNRVVGLVDIMGIINTTTSLGDAFSGGNPRSATSTNGTDIWVAGSNQSVKYTTAGASTSTQLSTAPTNVRVVNIFGNQLYVSSSSSGNYGVCTVGAGLPTTSGQTTTLLAGFPTSSGPSSYDYYFANSSTLYVADDRTVPNGGIQKWTFNGSTWTLAYTLTSTNGMRGLTGTTDGLGNTVLYAIMASSQTSLVSVTDLGAGSPVSIVATSGTNTAFRGVDFSPIPEPTTLVLVGLGLAMWMRRR